MITKWMIFSVVLKKLNIVIVHFHFSYYCYCYCLLPLVVLFPSPFQYFHFIPRKILSFVLFLNPRLIRFVVVIWLNQRWFGSVTLLFRQLGISCVMFLRLYFSIILNCCRIMSYRATNTRKHNKAQERMTIWILNLNLKKTKFFKFLLVIWCERRFLYFTPNDSSAAWELHNNFINIACSNGRQLTH